MKCKHICHTLWISTAAIETTYPVPIPLFRQVPGIPVPATEGSRTPDKPLGEQGKISAEDLEPSIMKGAVTNWTKVEPDPEGFWTPARNNWKVEMQQCYLQYTYCRSRMNYSGTGSFK